MNILILKTNINTSEKLNYVGQLLKLIPQIKKWSIDHEDVDNVLRIEAEEKLTELDVIEFLNGKYINVIEFLNGKYIICEELTY